MASTKQVPASYSSTLAGMINYVRGFTKNTPVDKKMDLRLDKALYDFCYNYPPAFTRNFLKIIGVGKFKVFPRQHIDNDFVDSFVRKLNKLDGECVFLLKDTCDIASAYQQKNKKGFGILVNRYFFYGGDEQEYYFKFIKLFYDALTRTSTLSGFFDEYVRLFKRWIKHDQNLRMCAQSIFDYVNSHRSKRQIIFVDTGFQFTLSMACYAAVRILSRGTITPDVYILSGYPWLQSRLGQKIFSNNNLPVMDIQLRAIANYRSAMKNQAAGCMVGFAIGDALGAPVAGIDRLDIRRDFFKKDFTTFQINARHPYLGHLRIGQYTYCTEALLLSAENIVQHYGFNLDSYLNLLKRWMNDIERGVRKERWAGSVFKKAIKNLIAGNDYQDSGITTTQSCSSTYRVIPIGIFYRGNIEETKRLSILSGALTHNSDISRTGTVLTSLIIAFLLNGDTPEKTINAALKLVKPTNENKKLIMCMQEAIRFSKTKTVEFARKYFGTGSPIYMTLPLAVFCFLKYQNNFEKGILAAANSYRDDTQEEKQRLKGLSWEEQLIEARGGNADGIAGLTGAFLGAYLGLNKIPKKFLKVENKKKLERLGHDLVSFRYG